MSVTAISISGRADKGLSRPFFCEGDDGNFYFVKGGNVSPDQLIIEYAISRLAEECGLPVAPLTLLEVPAALSDYALIDHREEFLPGVVFGSRRTPFAEELRTSHVSQIDEESRMRCLCFDWWVRNPDRCLGIVGGDPNVLWDPVEQGMVLIDHDHCLADDFEEEAFKRGHVFREIRPFLDKAFFERWRTTFESSIYNLESIWNEMPKTWFEDENGISKSTLTRQSVEAALIKPELPAEDILPS